MTAVTWFDDHNSPTNRSRPTLHEQRAGLVASNASLCIFRRVWKAGRGVRRRSRAGSGRKQVLEKRGLIVSSLCEAAHDSWRPPCVRCNYSISLNTICMCVAHLARLVLMFVRGHSCTDFSSTVVVCSQRWVVVYFHLPLDNCPAPAIPPTSCQRWSLVDVLFDTRETLYIGKTIE